MTRPIKYITVTVAIVAAVAVIYYYSRFDPVLSLSFRCPIKSLTGYDCPGCGSQRALHAVLCGDFRSAWSLNPLMFFAAPLAAVYIVVESYPARFARLHRLLVRPIVVAFVLIAIIAWTVLRNIFD
jgi:hypothetical protein